VPKEGIDREVITADICRYLGNDALVRPGSYEVSLEGEHHQTLNKALTNALAESTDETASTRLLYHSIPKSHNRNIAPYKETKSIINDLSTGHDCGSQGRFRKMGHGAKTNRLKRATFKWYSFMERLGRNSS
jgi:hypothetical protein